MLPFYIISQVGRGSLSMLTNLDGRCLCGCTRGRKQMTPALAQEKTKDPKIKFWEEKKEMTVINRGIEVKHSVQHNCFLLIFTNIHCSGLTSWRGLGQLLS